MAKYRYIIASIVYFTIIIIGVVVFNHVGILTFLSGFFVGSLSMAVAIITELILDNEE